MQAYFYLLRQPDAHQCHVITDKVKLFLQWNKGLLIVVKYVSEQFAQFLNRFLRLVTVECYQCIDIIQCVEQEMGVQLVLEILQFRFRLLPFGFQKHFLRLSPSQAGADGSSQSGNEYHQHDVAYVEYPAWRHPPGKFLGWRSAEGFQQQVKHQ